MNITVFLSAFSNVPSHIDATRTLGKLIGEDGHTLIWGGSAKGLMKIIGDSVRDAGGTVIARPLRVYEEFVYKDAEDIQFSETLGERKEKLINGTDAFVVLPGGVGTFDELGDVIELRKQEKHRCPIIIINTDGFYDGLSIQMKRMEKDGMLKHSASTYLTFVDTPEEAMEQLAS